MAPTAVGADGAVIHFDLFRRLSSDPVERGSKPRHCRRSGSCGVVAAPSAYGSISDRRQQYLEPLKPVADSLLIELQVPRASIETFVSHCKRQDIDIFFEPNECPRTKELLTRTADLRLLTSAGECATAAAGHSACTS
jgi:hypothetical protein